MTNCKRCGRALKNPEAIKKQIGPVCERKQVISDATEEAAGEDMVIEPSPHACGKVIMRRDEAGNARVNIRHEHVKHSPTGFEWGYAGSGPADLARNILIQVTGSDYKYQDFKFKFIAGIPREGGEINVTDILKWREENQQPLAEKYGEIEV